MSKQIHWYPGHMKKAQIEVEEKLKLVDCIIEVLDARSPISSRNTALYKLTANKKRLVVLTKSDLADDILTKKWSEHFKNENIECVFANLNNNSDVKQIIKYVENIKTSRNDKLLEKGFKPQPIRAMIIGIPNVGKSTLINKMAKRYAASVQNKPGHTKGQQWIKVSDKFELLDTPGILPPNFDDKTSSIFLALLGSINQDILPFDELADCLLNFLKTNYSSLFIKRYNFDPTNLENHLICEKLAQERGYFTKDGFDIEKAQRLLLNEFKNGVIGKITLERDI